MTTRKPLVLVSGNLRELPSGDTTDTLNLFLDKGSIASGTVTVTVSSAGNQRITATGNITLAITGWPASGTFSKLQLDCVNFGGKTITFPTINWVKSDGSFTTTFSSSGVTLQSAGTDFITLWTSNGGTTVYGKVIR